MAGSGVKSCVSRARFFCTDQVLLSVCLRIIVGRLKAVAKSTGIRRKVCLAGAASSWFKRCVVACELIKWTIFAIINLYALPGTSSVWNLRFIRHSFLLRDLLLHVRLSQTLCGGDFCRWAISLVGYWIEDCHRNQPNSCLCVVQIPGDKILLGDHTLFLQWLFGIKDIFSIIST